MGNNCKAGISSFFWKKSSGPGHKGLVKAIVAPRVFINPDCHCERSEAISLPSHSTEIATSLTLLAMTGGKKVLVMAVNGMSFLGLGCVTVPLFSRFSSEAFFFQLFHKPGGSGVANAEAALQKGSRDVFVFFG